MRSTWKQQVRLSILCDFSYVCWYHIYNPNSCGQHFFNEFTHVTSWRQKLLPFKRHVSGREEFHLFVRGALFQKEQNCFESGVLIFHTNFCGSCLEKTIPSQYSHLFACFNQKMPLVNYQVYCSLTLNFLTLQTDVEILYSAHVLLSQRLPLNFKRESHTPSWYVIGFPSLAFLQMAF